MLRHTSLDKINDSQFLLTYAESSVDQLPRKLASHITDTALPPKLGF